MLQPLIQDRDRLEQIFAATALDSRRLFFQGQDGSNSLHWQVQTPAIAGALLFS